jgi:hypothetical protein
LKTKVSFNSWSIFVTKLEKRSKSIKESYESKPFETNLSESDSNDVMKKLGAIIALADKEIPTGTVEIEGVKLLTTAKEVCADYKNENKLFAAKTSEILDISDDTKIDAILLDLVDKNDSEKVLKLLGVSKPDDNSPTNARFSGAIGSTISGIVFTTREKGDDKKALSHLESEHVSEKHDISDVTVKTANLNDLVTLLKDLAKATKDGYKIGTEIADEFKRAIDNIKSFRRKRDGESDTDSAKKNLVNSYNRFQELNAFHTPSERYHTYTSTISGLISYVNMSLDYFDKKGKKDKK